MASSLDRLLASTDVSDPSDFPDTAEAPGLRVLDDALRCDICRDFYDAPVSLACGHSFCSAVLHTLCTACECDMPIMQKAGVGGAYQEERGGRECGTGVEGGQEHERKTRPPPPRDTRTHSKDPPRKRKRSGTPLTVSEDEIIILPSSPVASGSATPDALPETVECPICQKLVHSPRINMHIDSGCKRHIAETVPNATVPDPKGKQKQQWSLLLNKAGGAAATKTRDRGKGKSRHKDTSEGDAEPEHLPKVAYDIHPQRRVAEMLAEWGLPTHGDKNALVRRHSRWIVLYNANVDRAPENRRTVEQLRLELRKAEEAEGKTRKGTVDDPVAYQRANKTAFAKLTEAARPKKPVPKREDAGRQEATEGARAKDAIDVDAS